MSRIKETYVPVHVRVMDARREHKDKLTIKTSITMYPEQSSALVCAEVLLNGNLLATGHAIATDLDEEKGLEKAESVAVGRALAFAGYSADSSIASTEEMEGIQQPESKSNETTKPTGFGSRRS